MGSLFSSQHTKALQEVIREIETDPKEYLGAELMPAKVIPSRSVFVDVLEARGGLIKEHTYNTDPQKGKRRQFRTQQFAPGVYRETVQLTEDDILYLRELGQNDQSKRGIRQHLNENALVLNNKIEARIELLRWQAILNGTYTYDGKVVDFGKPGNHDVAPVEPWGFNDGLGNFTDTNPASTPVQDMRYWIMGGYAPFRKYVVEEVIMNPNTARMVLDNPAVQSLIQSRFASEAYKMHDINAVMGFLVPGMPPIKIYKGWYQSETEDSTTGQITVGDAIYFLPDGRLFFKCKLPDGDKVGDVQLGLNLSNGSIDNPTAGKFIIVKEHIEDRPENPYVNIVGGFAGGPRLKRGFDCLTGTVI